MNRKHNKFERFFNSRQSLIEQYNKGDLTKQEFIEENYNFLLSMNTKPFSRIDNIKKGIFNYHYYNIIAKYWQKRAHEQGRYTLQREDFADKAEYYYSKKDNVTLRILKLMDFKNIDAYYVKVKSQNLKNKLIEIVLNDYDNIILHTKNENIKNRLKEEKILQDKKKISLVDSYINQKF